MGDAIELPKRLGVGPLAGQAINEKTGHVVADAYYGAHPQPSVLSAEIVRRWNAYDALVAVCKAASEVEEAQPFHNQAAMDELRAALAALNAQGGS